MFNHDMEMNCTLFRKFIDSVSSRSWVWNFHLFIAFGFALEPFTQICDHKVVI